MANLRVEPRDTPGERADTRVLIEIDDALAVYAASLEEWTDANEHWEISLRQGHDFDRTNNIEVRLLFTGPGHTCSLTFRLDQLDSIQELADERWLLFDEEDGIAKAVHLAPAGFDVELHHIVGPPLGGTSA